MSRVNHGFFCGRSNMLLVAASIQACTDANWLNFYFLQCVHSVGKQTRVVAL